MAYVLLAASWCVCMRSCQLATLSDDARAAHFRADGEAGKTNPLAREYCGIVPVLPLPLREARFHADAEKQAKQCDMT